MSQFTSMTPRSSRVLESVRALSRLVQGQVAATDPAVLRAGVVGEESRFPPPSRQVGACTPTMNWNAWERPRESWVAFHTENSPKRCLLRSAMCVCGLVWGVQVKILVFGGLATPRDVPGMMWAVQVVLKVAGKLNHPK